MFIVGSDSAMVPKMVGDATRKSRDDSSQRGAYPAFQPGLPRVHAVLCAQHSTKERTAWLKSYPKPADERLGR
jgi:hypothetical protein